MPEKIILGVIILLAVCALLYPIRARKLICLTLLPVLLAGITMAYGLWGGWFEWQAFQIGQKKAKEAKAVITQLGSIDNVIEKMKVHVANAPKDAKAWFLLGRVYASKSDWQNAYHAFNMARTLDTQSHEYALHYAQSVWETHEHHFDADTKALLLKLLSENPNEADALAMLALDAFNSAQYQQAVVYWERLLALEPNDREVQDKIRQAIAKARALSGSIL